MNVMQLLAAFLPYVLVVVDMQPGFLAARKPEVIAAVKREILAAMAAGLPIIVLECLSSKYGHTHPELLDLLKDYDSLKRIVLEKDGSGLGCGSGGGKEVSEACELLSYPTDSFRFVGVNSDICVLFTAVEVDRLFRPTRLELVRDACAGSSENQWQVFEYYAGHYQFSNYQIV